MDQQAFERGQRAAREALADWQGRKHQSPEACKQHLLRMARQNLQVAQAHVQAPRKLDHSGGWERQLAYMQGYLSALQ